MMDNVKQHNIMQHRNDIDGLRAIAILSVILFHINHQWLPGGFLGVDIFFVISGYLITSIIYTDLINNNFTFSHFYQKRIRRILPAFFFVMFSAIFLGLFLFDKGNQINLARSALESIKFIVNFYFARRNGYFDDTNEIPLLHFWSLAVEEQFYFIFPIVLICILRNKYLVNKIFYILFVLIVFSMLSQFIEIGLDRYYLFHLRAGELLVGSILAIYVLKIKPKSFNHPLSNILSFVSLLLLLACFVFFDKDLPLFPAISGLIPCLLTALLIFTGQADNVVCRLLSNKGLVFIGKISFSLYLWHWVLLAYTRYVYGTYEIPTNWLLILISITVLLSIFTFYFIENPIRRNNLGFKKSFFYFYIIPSAILFGLYRYIKIGEDTIIVEKSLMYPTEICHNNKLLPSCKKGDISKDDKILFIGDSHTGHLNNFIDLVGKSEGWSADVISRDSCYFLFDYIPTNKSYKPEKCIEYNNHI
ncbi:acyltransferase family protein, partial [Ursidibacter arcticus]